MKPQGFLKNSSHRKMGAFTLIELLVVIAIIGILASLLLPVLGRAKNQASRAVDMNNLKQITLSLTMYAGDNHDLLPLPNWSQQDFAFGPGWLYALDTNANIGPDAFKIEKGLLWPSLKDQRVYLCPMDYTNSSIFKEREQQLSSYVMNGAIIGFMRTNFPAQKLGNMLPGDVAYWEPDEQDITQFNDGASFPSEGLSVRHGNGAMDANFGGSVAFIKVDDWNTLSDDTSKNSVWCYPDSPDGR